MINMHERAQMLGGKLFITSALGRGTTVVLSVPLVEKRSESP
jgi:signal transduction histidine kinase